MSINNYKILISNLPVKQQCFTTKRKTWEKTEKQISWLKPLNDRLFDNQQKLTISRQDIFETTDLREVIIKTIYWGYTRGMRGNHFVNILNKIDLIEKKINSLQQTNKPNTDDFNEMASQFKDVTGLGLSTYSKLLYFFNLSFNDNPCVILDQRLIDVFTSKLYPEFQQLTGIRYGNAEKKYLYFLQLINQVAKILETQEENVEQFLFIFGNNIKNHKYVSK